MRPPWEVLPAPFPGPPLPLPGGLLEIGGEEDEPEVGMSLDGAFRNRMKTEGFNPELVEMGLKVAKNHMRPVEEAFKIGENYIKEMAK